MLQKAGFFYQPLLKTLKGTDKQHKQLLSKAMNFCVPVRYLSFHMTAYYLIINEVNWQRKPRKSCNIAMKVLFIR